MRIYIPEPSEISHQAKNILIKSGHELFESISANQESSIEVLFIRTYIKITKEYLSRFPNLTYIIRAGSGLDHIDLEECKQRHITVISSPGSNAFSVAEHALTMLLLLLKNIIGHSRNLSEGGWRSKDSQGNELRGKTIGLLGCGAVGQILSKLLLPFEVKILGYDKYLSPDKFKELNIQQVTLSELLKNSELVSIQIPLTKETVNLVTVKELSLMKKTACLVNVSRGEIVNEDDLITSISQGKIKSAALDVVKGEPTPNRRLSALENIFITPHIAGFTVEADEAIATDAVHNFLKAIEDHK